MGIPSVMHERNAILLRTGRYAWALLGIAGVAVLLWLVASRLAVVVVPLVLALFPAAALAPVVAWLHRHRVPRPLAALLVVLGLLGLVAGLVAVVVPSFVAQLPALGDALARGVQQLQPLLERLPGDQPVSVQSLAQQAAGALSGGGALSTALGATRSILEFLAGAVLLLVALFFYLYSGDRMARTLGPALPRERRRQARELGRQLWLTLGGFFRGQVIVALIDAVFIGIGLVLLDVPLALPLTVLVFLGGFFPVVGATVSGVLAALVALADGGIGTALAVVAIVVVVQQVEGNILEPLIMKRMLRLSAFTVLVAIAIGSAALGVLGAFLAVPVAAAIARVALFLHGQRADTDHADDPAADGAVAGAGPEDQRQRADGQSGATKGSEATAAVSSASEE